jgi:hypothetical protein
MDELGCLLLDRRDDLRVGMTGRVDRDAGSEVEEEVAVDVLDRQAFAADRDDRIGTRQARRGPRLVELDVRTGLGPWKLRDDVRNGALTADARWAGQRSPRLDVDAHHCIRTMQSGYSRRSIAEGFGDSRGSIQSVVRGRDRIARLRSRADTESGEAGHDEGDGIRRRGGVIHAGAVSAAGGLATARSARWRLTVTDDDRPDHAGMQRARVRVDAGCSERLGMFLARIEQTLPHVADRPTPGVGSSRCSGSGPSCPARPG